MKWKTEIIRSVEHENQRKYLRAPSYNQIKKYVYGTLKISMLKFERFFGIATGTMKQISFGNAQLPVKYWHIVYEKLKPNYGAGFFNPQTMQVEYTKIRKKKETPAPTKKQTERELAVNSLLLNKLKEQLQ